MDRKGTASAGYVTMKIGFIGMGNMAGALVQGLRRNGYTEEIYAYAPHQDKLQKNAERLCFTPCASLKELAEQADCLLLACKPYQAEAVLGEIKEELKGKILLSVALGWDQKRMKELLPETRCQYLMPNTPCAVGKGSLLFEESSSLSEEEKKEVWEIFGLCGQVEVIRDDLMGIAGTLTGCGPAFAAMIIEAFGDAGVKYGLPRAQAYRLVGGMLEGSGALLLDTQQHPGEMKDAVCSPGGSTIRGVCALEENGLRNACIQAIDAICAKK